MACELVYHKYMELAADGTTGEWEACTVKKIPARNFKLLSAQPVY